MRVLWRLCFIGFLALSCVVLGMSIRISFDWLNLRGAPGGSAVLDVDELERLRSELRGAPDPFESVIKVAKVVRPSVVSIDVEPRPRTNGFIVAQGTPRGGSGVILDADGHILTNWHVIGEAEPLRIRVKIGQDEARVHEAKLVAADPYSDLAVIRVEGDGLELVPAELADSDRVEVGQAAIAIGSPFALQGTVTLGTVSTTARAVEIGGDSDLFGSDIYIQTDAAINPGNSGGPLVDIRGRVIGINTMILTRTSAGVGFAIPMNYARRVAEQLIESGAVSRGGLGIRLSRYESRQLGMPEGALIAHVGPGTPAQAAGFEPDDLVVEFEGFRIRRNEDLVKQVQKTEQGREVRVVVLRGDRYLTLQPVVGDRDRATEGLQDLPDRTPFNGENRRQ